MRNVLDIQDKHIIFEENCVTFGERRKKKAKFIHCTLTYTPKECHKCGAENTNFTVYKNGTQTSCITFPMSGIYPTYLKLKKQRYMCKACESSFTAKTPIVEEHCYISNYVKANVLSPYMKTSIKTLKKALTSYQKYLYLPVHKRKNRGNE